MTTRPAPPRPAREGVRPLDGEHGETPGPAQQGQPTKPKEAPVADTHVTIVTITGNLTDDPELKFLPNGNAVANFRVAVAARVRDGETWRDGETSFFRVNAWRQLAEHVSDGSVALAVNGRVG